MIYTEHSSWCWTFGRKPSRLKSTLWYSPYLSSIFNFIMELQLSFSDINIQNDSHLQFHEVMKYLSTRNCTAHSSRKLMRFMKYVDVKCSCRSVALWFVYPNSFNNRATNLQLMWMLLFMTPLNLHSSKWNSCQSLWNDASQQNILGNKFIVLDTIKR